MAEQYLPLYRKYRPQVFGDLVGQENLVKAFTNAINVGKIAHAYLFCGPRGTGKTSSARILAKSLNCQHGPTLTPCGKCPSCLDILNGNMLDVIEMDAASNRSVEDAQNIIDKIHYAPVNGRYKIFIIDEVHMISKTAFNALLKTLEEPPENVIFILATTEPQKVLETIISRCQRFDFRRITVDDIVKRLKFISQKEGIKITDDALYAIAKNSQGGMRDALALLDQISLLDVSGEITVDKVHEMLGKIDNETLMQITKTIFEKSVNDAVQTVNEIYSKGNEPLQIIENLIQFFRNMTIAKTCKDDDTALKLTLLSKDMLDKMIALSKNVSINEVSGIIERLTYYYREIKYTNNRSLWLELCFIELASQMQQPQTSSVVIQSAAPQTVSKPVSKPVMQPAAQTVSPVSSSINEPAAQTPVEPSVKTEMSSSINEIRQPQTQASNQNGQDIWKAIISMVESPPARSYFNTFAKPAELSPEKVVIVFKDEMFCNRAKELPKYNAVKKACLKYYNVPKIELEIKMGTQPLNPVVKSGNDANSKEDKTPLSDSQDISAQTVATQPLTQETKSEKEPEKKTENSDLNKPISEKTEINSPVLSESYENEEDFSSQTEENGISYDGKNTYSDQVKMAIDLFGAKVFE